MKLVTKASATTRARGMKHMGIEKAFLLDLIQERDDWRDLLPGFTGTREEAMISIDEDPRHVFAGCACRKNADGSCSGEPA